MYTPLSIHSHYSLLRGFSKADKLIKYAANLGINSIALTDFDKMSGVPPFIQSCNKNDIKPIIGSKIYVSDDNGYVTVIAKNHEGWKELINLSSLSHDKNHFNKKPSISFDELANLKNVIVISGESNSTLSNAIIDKNLVYLVNTSLSDESYYFKNDYISGLSKLVEKYKSSFGENFFISINKVNEDVCVVDTIVADILRNVAKKNNINCVGVPSCFYTHPEDKDDHNLLLCSFYKTTLNKLHSDINTEDKASLARFVRSDKCHLLSFDEMKNFHTEDELKNTNLVADMCEKFNIFSQPILPNFSCPDGFGNSTYLRHLCRLGWARLTNESKIDLSRTQEYVDRINMELSVFNKASLDGYFLIVQDYIKWAKGNKILVGPGRGCFTPETRVKMFNGQFKSISMIKIGDEVVDAYGNKQTVYNTLRYDVDEDILQLTLENNNIIRCTKDHKFLTNNRGWIEAQFLTDDDEVAIKIVKKTVVPYKGVVCDLSVTNSHSYNVESLSVHNSCGGSLASYLLDIITIDPILHDLYFERFYNDGRNSKDKISLPDIDTDFPVHERQSVINYIINKYGKEHVSQVCTFSTLQGRGAFKEVVRIHNGCEQSLMNDISKKIPNKAEIEDKMQEAKEVSILRWTLRNYPDLLKEFCTLDDKGNYSGQMAQYFEQAVRIEGTNKSYGKHASAVTISRDKIANITPMINDKSTGELIAGTEYEHLELMGVPKFDILGVTVLSKLQGVNSLLKTGKLNNIVFESEEEE